MRLELTAYAAIHFLSFSMGSMIPKIVGGHYANISQFPHVAHIKFKCVFLNGQTGYYLCGSSIVNQEFLMTAAHCTHKCRKGSYIIATVGHCNSKKGQLYFGYSYLIHENYGDRTMVNDIALIRLRTQIKFSDIVKRVALMKKPPYKEKAQVAGWGYTSEDATCTDDLKYVDQYVWSKSICERVLHRIPKGTFCASSGSEFDYPAVGDSGSALVVRGYIQIGIVSFKKPELRNDVIIYTDVGYFYDWITESINFLICDDDEEDEMTYYEI